MNPRDRRALLLGASLIVLVLVYRFALSPVVDRWQTARTTAQSQADLINQFEEKLDRRDAIRARLRPRFGPGVNAPLPTLDNARVAFPRTVQEALTRGGAKPTQIEVQSVRRIRNLPGVERLSLRVTALCNPNAIPKMLRELTNADLPVVVDSISISMLKQNQRNQWQAVMLLSTPARTAPQKRSTL